MPVFIPPERARQITRLQIEIELARNAITALTARVDGLDERLAYLTRDRNRGMTRTALDILRRAKRPMGLRELTVALMGTKGLDPADPALVNREMEKLRVSLTRQWEAGIVAREKGPGLTMVWKIAIT